MNFKTTIVILIFLCSFVSFQACRDEFDFKEMKNQLYVSSDTIHLDTIFNYSKSETYVLKLYNKDNEDYFIPSINLAKGENSYFKINVDGKSGFTFTNVPIRKKDSLFIFIEIDAQSAPNNPFYEDEVLIKTLQHSQKVKLISWIEKAKLYTANTTLTSENWNSNEAHIIDGNLSISESLTIAQGTKVYFKKNASLTIANNAKLVVNGILGNEVKFRSARHGKKYDSIPNQWKKIELKQGSQSKINYAKIIGADIGLDVNDANLEISNSYIVNHQSYGIFANNANIKAHNILVNNANLAALAIENGGHYEFYQSTFANFFNMIGSVGPAYALSINNNANPLTNATFANCIFYNLRTPNSIVLNKNNNIPFNYLFDTNLFKNANTFDLNVLTESNFQHSIVGNPLFVNPIYTANKLSLQGKSPALNVGNLIIAHQYPTDYYGNNRTENPSLGAIQ